MGGLGSGRKPDPVKGLINSKAGTVNESSDLYLPNYSGVKDEAKKTSDENIIDQTILFVNDSSTPVAVGGTYPNFTVNYNPNLIDHTTIANKGTNTHAQIDSHIADSDIHFTEGSIDHVSILNVGINSHSVIDTHLADTNKHIDWTNATNNFLTTGTNQSATYKAFQDSNTYTNILGYAVNVEEGSTNANGPRVSVGWSSGPVGVMDLIFANRNTDGLRLGTNAGYPVSFIQNNATKMYINTSGNVGIGTTSYSRKLTVDAGTTNEVAQFISTDQFAGIMLTDNSGTARIYTDGGGLLVQVDDGTTSPFVIETGTASNTLYLKGSNDNVGINTSSPTARLHVVGSNGAANTDADDGFIVTAGNGGTVSSGNGKRGGDISLTAGEGSDGVGAADGGHGGDITITAGNGGLEDGGTQGLGGSITLTLGQNSNTGSGNLIINNLPTSNPSVAGALWSDGGTIKISSG